MAKKQGFRISDDLPVGQPAEGTPAKTRRVLTSIEAQTVAEMKKRGMLPRTGKPPAAD